MLNRNNLTLSALSNRLNLGTRSLVLKTGVNNGTALRIRNIHHDVMREHAGWFFATSAPVEVCVIPPITGPATAAAARLKKAWADAWKPDAADARLVPAQAQAWQGWPSGRPNAVPGSGSGRHSSSRSRRSTAQAGGVESRRRPRPSLETIEARGAAWESRAASRRSAIAAVAG
jgi:hypothetical protein